MHFVWAFKQEKNHGIFFECIKSVNRDFTPPSFLFKDIFYKVVEGARFDKNCIYPVN